jgi:hypothetical protein
MTAPTIHREQADAPEPHPGPAAVLAALAQFSSPGSLAMVDAEIDAAYRASLEAGDPSPLRKVLDRWWLVVRVQRGEVQPERPRGREQLAEVLARRGAAG